MYVGARWASVKEKLHKTLSYKVNKESALLAKYLYTYKSDSVMEWAEWVFNPSLVAFRLVGLLLTSNQIWNFQYFWSCIEVWNVRYAQFSEENNGWKWCKAILHLIMSYSGKKVKPWCEMASCISMLWIIKSNLSWKRSHFLASDSVVVTLLLLIIKAHWNERLPATSVPQFTRCDHTVQYHTVRADDT